jgi:hypothetical protein
MRGTGAGVILACNRVSLGAALAPARRVLHLDPAMILRAR